MSIKSLGRVILISGALVVSANSHELPDDFGDEIKGAVSNAIPSAEQLYTQQPPVTPALAFPGTYAVGVTTLTATDPTRLNTANFLLNKERQLVVEVWYPAGLAKDQDDEQTLATYKNVTRLQNPFELQGEAHRGVPAIADGSFPLVLLSHGFTGYRTQMFYLGEHLASHGYVVVGIDHTGSTNADIKSEADRAPGFTDTLYNRARDQQFLLDYFAHQASPVETIVDTNNAAIIGHSMGGFGAINTVGGCYAFESEFFKKLGVPSAIALVLPFALDSCYGGQYSYWHPGGVRRMFMMLPLWQTLANPPFTLPVIRTTPRASKTASKNSTSVPALNITTCWYLKMRGTILVPILHRRRPLPQILNWAITSIRSGIQKPSIG